MDTQTIIVGGGMAGMSCALRLKAYNKPFSRDYTASALEVNWDGTYVLYTRTPDANLDEYFKNYDFICRYDWDKAMYVHGREFLVERYDECLLIAGDHNGLGLEPATVSGIHAANQIMKNS